MRPEVLKTYFEGQIYHLATCQHDRYIKVNHLSDRHRTSRETAQHTFETH